MVRSRAGEWVTLYSAVKLTNSPKAVIIREIDLGGVSIDKNLCFCGSGKKHKDCHSQISENSAMAYLFEAFKIIDNDISSDTRPECQKGCNSCCSDYFDVSPIEFLGILNFIQENRTGMFFRRAHRMARLNLPSFKPLNNDNMNIEGFSPCIFVDNRNGKCKIYEARPLLCRLYGYYEQFTDCGKASSLLRFHDNEHLSKLLGDISTEHGLIRLPAMPIVYWFGNSFAQSGDTQKAFSELYAISMGDSINTYIRFIVDNSDIFSTLFSS